MKIIVCAFALFITTMEAYYSQSFLGSFDLIATQQYQNGNARSDTISYCFGVDNTALLIHARNNQPDLRMVFSFKEATITSLFELNDKKGGYILPMNESYWPGMPQAVRDFGTGPRTQQNYTGKEKDIEGYVCREVLVENDEYVVSLWVAETIPLSMTHVLSYQSVGKGKSKKEIELFDKFGVEGLPLELFLKSKTEKADVSIQLINISDAVNEAMFSNEGHVLSKVD